MANSGGGVIAYGVTESQKKATGRKDIGQLTENHERSLRQVAISAISPPIFGLTIMRLGSEGSRAVAIVIPSSVDGPHLVYRGEYFGALGSPGCLCWQASPNTRKSGGRGSVP